MDRKSGLNLLLLKMHFMIYLEVKFLPKVALDLEDTVADYYDFKNHSLYAIHSKHLHLTCLCIALICDVKIHSIILFFKAAS